MMDNKQMGFYMRKFILFYMAIMLSFAPMSVYAEGKKSHKHKAHISKKHKVSSKSRHHRLASRKLKDDFANAYDGSGPLQLASSKVLVINQLTGEKLFEKNTSKGKGFAHGANNDDMRIFRDHSYGRLLL